VRREFVRFLIVGAMNTAISLGVYRALLALGVWYVVSAPVAWAAGVVNGYVWNLRWTFAGRDTTRARTLYALFGAAGAGVASVLVFLFVRGAGLGKFEAYLAAVPLVTVSTFLANRYWTFSDRAA
jgi:putative flippase GtrA